MTMKDFVDLLSKSKVFLKHLHLIRRSADAPTREGSDGELLYAPEYPDPTGPLFVRHNGAPLGLRGTGAAPTGNDGYALIEIGGVAAFRPILSSYIDPSFGISAFNFSGVSNPQEVGSTVASPAFVASYSEAPDSAAVIDNQGNPSLDISLTPGSFTYAHSYTKATNNAAVQFTLSAIKGAASSSRSLNLNWLPKIYWGVGPAGISTEADIKGLANQPLQANRANTFTANPGPLEYIYYAYPDSYGAATFFVDGWEGGFDLIGTVSITNAHGVTQDYRLYQSSNPGLGSTTIQVT